jgi:hypothetical protein
MDRNEALDQQLTSLLQGTRALLDRTAKTIAGMPEDIAQLNLMLSQSQVALLAAILAELAHTRQVSVPGFQNTRGNARPSEK